jgi:selenide,water dikinase
MALGEQEPLLCDPQTSGGLLMALAPDRAADLVQSLVERGHAAAVVGEICGGSGPQVRFAN